MTAIQELSAQFYENSYATHGLAAQRRYPNEEFCRFVGGKLPSLLAVQKVEFRKDIKVLEVGCGTGANLWMLVREGFDVYGMDFSPSAVELCKEVVAPFGTAHIDQGDMRNLAYEDAFFDSICDVFSGYCFSHAEYLGVLKEISRVLKPQGLFFFYTPCVTSKAFIDYAPANKIDEYTLDGIKRKDSSFVGNVYPFHFLDENIVDSIMESVGLKRLTLERTTRTYNGMTEPFSHLVGVYTKL